MNLEDVKRMIGNHEFVETVLKFQNEEFYLNKTKITYSLKECLSLVSEEFLDAIYIIYKDFYNLKDVKTREKKETILYEEIKKSFVDHLRSINCEDMLLIKELIENRKIKTKKLHLISNAFVFAFYENKEIVYVIPDDLREVYQKTYTKEFQKEINIEKVKKYLRGYLLINGLVSKDFFYDLINNYYKINLTKKEINQIAEENKILVYKNKYFCLEFPDMSIYDVLLENELVKTYIKFDEEKIDAYFYFYYESINFLRKILKDENQVYLILTSFTFSYTNDENIVDILIANKKISKKKGEKIKEFLINIRDNIRFWDLKGRCEKEFNREITIDHFLISEKPRKTDLKSCLKSLNDDAYEMIYYNYFDKDDHLLDELIEKILESLKENIDKGEKCAHCLLLNKDLELDFNLDDQDIESGYAFIYQEKDIVKVMFPDEILKILEDNNNFDDDFFPNDYFDDLMTGYVHQNGIIKREKLQELLKENHDYEVSLDDLDNNLLEFGILIRDGYYTSIQDINEDRIKELEDLKSKVSKYKEIDFDVLENEERLFQELSLLNQQEIGYSESKFQEFIDIVFIGIKHYVLSTEMYYMIFEDNHFKVNLKQADKIVDIIKKYKNNISVWIYNGYTVNEYKKISKKVKIGRNEKCPCGSGKKYKQCCGK